jgi:hypothetical protein
MKGGVMKPNKVVPNDVRDIFDEIHKALLRLDDGRVNQAKAKAHLRALLIRADAMNAWNNSTNMQAARAVLHARVGL